jgi:beta-mannosidase
MLLNLRNRHGSKMIIRKTTTLLFFSIILAFKLAAQQAPLVREINQGWQFHKVGTNDWHAAVVPGCVHTDLLANKMIPDPFYRDNESKLQWIDKYSWEYKTIINIDKTTLDRQNIELSFKGLDTYGEVYLNDKHILTTDNMFCEWNTDIKKILVEGDNTLKILFHSPIAMGILSRDQFNLEAPAGYNLEFVANSDWPSVGPYIRKAAYMFGWDWGPKLTTSGIWRPVYLKAWDIARITGLQIIQDSVTAKKATLSALITIEAASAFEGNINLSYSLNSKNIAISPHPVKLLKGLNEIRIDLTINNPALWWPNGLGDHPVYEFTGSLMIGQKEIDRFKTHSGLRTIKLVQNQEKDGGKSFYFEVNGIPVFAKGANYIPSDIFPSRVADKHYEELINSAADANMNMFRVWGGGIYENDIFYDLCDKNGIMIWQDFAFAAHSPDYPEFQESMRREFKENILRLRNHPCIALWCGNNEIDLVWNILMKKYFGIEIPKEANLLSGILPYLPAPGKVDPKVTERVMKAYDDIFYKMIPEAIRLYDYNSHEYWPSSPMGGYKEPMTLNKPQSGDMHYYVAYINKPFSNIPETPSRFFSEHGFQSWPDKKVVYQFTAPEDRDKNSPVMKAHNKAMIGNSVLDKYIKMYYRLPKDFDSYIYVTQVLQNACMKLSFETHRRWMPYTMGSLYWQLNDVWPVASWASIDFQNNPKGLYYIVKKAFNPIIVVPSDFKNRFMVNVVSDSQESFKAKLEMRILDFSGKMLWHKSIPVKMAANTSSEFFNSDTKELLNNMDTTQIVFSVKLLQGNKLLASNLFYFSSPKDLRLPKPTITKFISDSDQGYSITLSSDKLVRDLYIDTEEKGQFSDNYFDLLPGEKVTVSFKTNEKIDNFESKIKLYSLIDSF